MLVDRSDPRLLRLFRGWLRRCFPETGLLRRRAELQEFIDQRVVPFQCLAHSLGSALASLPSSRTPQHFYPYRPARVRLRSGRTLDAVLFVGELQYGASWGWAARNHVPVHEMADVSQSPYQLPPAVADQVHAMGETSMGATTYDLLMSDGELFRVTAGNLSAEFVRLPPRYSMKDIVEARRVTARKVRRRHLSSPLDAFCVYAEPEEVVRRALRAVSFPVSAEEYLRLRPVAPNKIPG